MPALTPSVIILSGSIISAATEKSDLAALGPIAIPALVSIVALVVSAYTIKVNRILQEKLQTEKLKHETEMSDKNHQKELEKNLKEQRVIAGARFIRAIMKLEMENNLAYLENTKDSWLKAIESAFVVMEEIRHFQTYLRNFEPFEFDENKFTGARDFLERYHTALRYYVILHKIVHILSIGQGIIGGGVNGKPKYHEPFNSLFVNEENRLPKVEGAITNGMRGALNIIRQEINGEEIRYEIHPRSLDCL